MGGTYPLIYFCSSAGSITGAVFNSKSTWKTCALLPLRSGWSAAGAQALELVGLGGTALSGSIPYGPTHTLQNLPLQECCKLGW